MNNEPINHFDIYQINPGDLDDENRLKLEMQKMMPVVELMKIKAEPHTLMGLQRDQKLRAMGYNEEEIEQLTGYKRGGRHILDMEYNLTEAELYILNQQFLGKVRKLKQDERAEEENMPDFEI